MHIPRLKPSARPPLAWPPTPSWRMAVVGVVAFGIAAVIKELMLPLLVEAGEHFASGPLLMRARLGAELVVGVVAGYIYVSAGILGRKKLLHSRYGDAGEFVKLVASVPLLLAVGVPCGYGTLQAAASASAPASAAAPASHALLAHATSGLNAPTVSYTRFWLWYVLGLHFCFADTSAFLQSWGSKFGAAARWVTCSRSESLFSLSLALGLTGAALHIGKLIAAAHEDVTFVMLLVAVLVLVLIVAPAWWRRGSHSLHLHHYVCAALLMPFTAFPTRIAGLQAAALGVFVEGIAVWGMDPLLVPRALQPLDMIATDVATRCWLSLSHLMANPQRYLAALQQMQLLHAGIEARLDSIASEGAGCVPESRNSGAQDREEGEKVRKQVASLLDKVQWQHLKRSKAIAADIKALQTLLGVAPVPTAPATVTAATVTASDAVTDILDVVDEGLARGAALACVAALLRSVCLAPLAGARELRQLAALHLHQGSYGIVESTLAAAGADAAEAAMRAAADADGSANSSKAVDSYFRFQPQVDRDPAMHTRYHQQVRTAAEEAEALVLRPSVLLASLQKLKQSGAGKGRDKDVAAERAVHARGVEADRDRRRVYISVLWIVHTRLEALLAPQGPVPVVDAATGRRRKRARGGNDDDDEEEEAEEEEGTHDD